MWIFTDQAPFLKLSSAETAEQLSKNTITPASINETKIFCKPCNFVKRWTECLEMIHWTLGGCYEMILEHK